MGKQEEEIYSAVGLAPFLPKLAYGLKYTYVDS